MRCGLQEWFTKAAVELLNRFLKQTWTHEQLFEGEDAQPIMFVDYLRPGVEVKRPKRPKPQSSDPILGIIGSSALPPNPANIHARTHARTKESQPRKS